MKKKIMIVTFVLVALIPLGSASAYQGGLLDGKELKLYSDDTNFTNISEVTDSNDSTFINLYSYSRTKRIVYQFTEPVDISTFKHKSTGIDFTVYFFSEYTNDPFSSSGLLGKTKPTTADGLTDASYQNVKTMIIWSDSPNTLYLNEFDLFESEPVIDTVPPGDVTGIVSSPDEESISFYYNLPSDEDFSHIKIMRDRELIAAEHTTDYFNDTGLEPETTYEYTFISVDESGNESAGVSKSVTTAEKFIPMKDISNLKTDTEYNRVDLSWNLPNSTEFKHVNIYRDVVEEQGFFQTLFFGTMVSAADEPTKIFETNGTYFNDLTVQPETTYEYKLTSQSTTGEETEGVTVQTTTEKEPKPDISDIETDRTENGDFLYKWGEPTEGTVKIIVGGQEYTVVPAESGEIIIPKEDMAYTGMGDADVSLVPIGVFGTEGDSYDSPSGFEKVKLPFSALGLLKSSMGLVGVLGGLILLALSFHLFPRIRELINKSMAKRNERRRG